MDSHPRPSRPVIVIYPLGELMVLIEGNEMPDSSGEIMQPGSFCRKVGRINF